VARPLTLESLEGRLCPSQYLLVTDGTHNAVQRYDGTDGHFIDTFVLAASSGMTAPDLGIIPDPSGQDFLVDGSGLHNVTRYSLVDGSPDPAPGQSGADFVPAGSGGLAAPEGIGFGPNGDLYVSNDTNPGGQVLRYDGATGAFQDVFLDGGHSRGVANDLHIGPDGNLYVSDYEVTGHLFRFDPTTGAYLPGPGRNGPNFVDPLMGYANGFTFGPDGNLYVAADYTSANALGSVLRFDGTTGDPLPAEGQSGAVFVPAGSGGVGFIDGITFGDDGNLYVTDDTHHSVLKYDGTTGDALGTFVAPGDGGLGAPGGLLFYNTPVSGERIVNGDFEQGNVGFTSDYQFHIMSPGAYDIVTDPQQFNIYATSYGDHTTGSGLMMTMDGALTPNQVVWSETVAVAPHTTYDFSAWVSTCYPLSPARLDFMFNGSSAGVYTAPATAGVWQQFQTTWDSGASAAVTVSVIDRNTDFSGNDFALDDISLRAAEGGTAATVPTRLAQEPRDAVFATAGIGSQGPVRDSGPAPATVPPATSPPLASPDAGELARTAAEPTPVGQLLVVDRSEEATLPGDLGLSLPAMDPLGGP
jgi:sugar lactone lactonase YvrE